MNINNIHNIIIKIHNNKLFEATIITVIILSSLLIGVKTFDEATNNYIKILGHLDFLVTIFFLIEITIRFIAWQPKKSFFNNAWNVFDAIVVTISLIPISESEFVLLARLVRVFRIMRLVSAVPELRKLVTALLRSLPSMGYVVMMMFILFYIYGAIGSFIFTSINQELWGNIATSMLTLFRIITFEDWTDVMYETMEVHSWSWFYYLSFIFFNAFVFLNMMIGIVIEKMQEQDSKQDEALAQINKRLINIEKKLNK